MTTQNNTPPFWQYDAAYWLVKLKSSEQGLSTEDAQERLAASGKLKIKISPFRKDVGLFVSQFTDPMMLLLIGAVILSAFLGDTSDVLNYPFYCTFHRHIKFYPGA